MQLDLPRRTLTLASITTILAFATSDARAQYASDFEALEVVPAQFPFAPDLWDVAAAQGTPGQDNYYTPNTTSVPHKAQIYTGGVVTAGINDYGIVDNPTGGAIFIAGNGPAGGTFARAQRDMTYVPATGCWSWSTDICCMFDPAGNLPTAQNLGSFSVQPFPGSQNFIMLARWTDPATATNWNADYVWFNASGAQMTASVADPGFQGLLVNHWYRWETIADLTTNRIVEVRITDLTSGTTVTNNPGTYMEGGTGGSSTPTGFRFFAGGGVAGNIIAWDNPRVLPHPGTINEIPGCGSNPANSLTTTGNPVAGNTMVFHVDAPSGIVTAGSLAGLAVSFAPDPNLPCGTPLPGITGNLLIGAPPLFTLLDLSGWGGPGSPVNFSFMMPGGFPGLQIFVTGALLDPGTSTVMVTTAVQLIIC